MRTLRNSIRAPRAIGIVFSIIFVVYDSPGAIAGHSDSLLPEDTYLPLTVGNSWSYECSVEGEFQFRKKLTITSVSITGRHSTYRAEMRVGSDPKPLVSYLSIDSNGQVTTSLTPTPDNLEPLINAAPKVGDHLGKLTVVAIERSTLKKFAGVETVRLENFSADDPKVPETKRLEWLGKTYGKGIGLLEESDGLGGICILVTYRTKAPK
jgi:hypothetical protein